MMMQTQIAPSAPNLEELLWSWKSVIRNAPDGWARNFALSIAKQAKRKDWQPTAKQLGIMRKMVSDLYHDARPDEAEDWNPIDEEDSPA